MLYLFFLVIFGCFIATAVALLIVRGIPQVRNAFLLTGGLLAWIIEKVLAYITARKRDESLNIAEEFPNVVDKSLWSDVFRRHLPFLLGHMDPDFGLLPKLVSKETLSYEQRDTVKAKETVNKRNGELLDIIRSENKWDGLVDALKISQQTHVVNYLEADGKHSSDEDWPLGEPEEKILRTNLDQLIELIEGEELIVDLFSNEVINRSQLDFIEEKQTSLKKNEAFIDILRRRSIRDYNMTIYCLRKTKQDHIALLLEKGGGVVRLHVNTDADPRVEENIAAKIKNMLANYSLERQCRILSLAGLDANVIAVKHGHSVVLYVYLQTLEQLIRMKESFQSGIIKDKVQHFFNTITASTSEHVVVLSVTVAEDEVSHVEDSLRENKIWTTSPRLVQTIKAEDKEHISAVAIAGEELFFTCLSRPEINVYDLSSLTFRRKCAIDGLKNPFDLASCKTNNCLYILDRIGGQDRKENKIIRSTVSGEILHSWSTDPSSECISVASDSNIVVTSKHSILEYTSEGEEVRVNTLSGDYKNAILNHAINLRTDHILVSLANRHYSVLILDKNGDVKVEGPKGMDNESLGDPCYMAIDSYGNIIVIDRSQSRLLALDANLKFKHVLIPALKDGMSYPVRLAVDESTGRLFVVAHNSTDEKWVVFVFKFG